MIRLLRDPTFWQAVAEHPQVRPHLGGGEVSALAEIVTNPLVLPLASEHGGFIFMQRDHFGRLFELHTMFLPEAWGTREIPLAAHEAFTVLFLRGADLCYTYEAATNRRSRPPLSHGWRPAGEFAPSTELAADVRTWVLTRLAWEQSPARSRLNCPSLSPS